MVLAEAKDEAEAGGLSIQIHSASIVVSSTTPLKNAILAKRISTRASTWNAHHTSHLVVWAEVEVEVAVAPEAGVNNNMVTTKVEA